MDNFQGIFDNYINEFNSFVTEKMSPNSFRGRESSGFFTALEAMSYSLENGGKRIRPVLVLEFCRACGGDYKNAMSFALAIEMIHTYSLIHDDLPCMDDDEMRRGKPSNHVVYGEANALLAGDGLLTLAFEELMNADLSADKKVEACKVLSQSAGFSGMIAGQVMDLDNENKNVSLDLLKATDLRKTGELIKAACLLGCIAAGADEEKKKAAIAYSENIGLAFQIVDDILDVTSSEEVLGKPVGSDDENQKSTYVSQLGLEEAQRYADKLTDEAVFALELFGNEGLFLKELAEVLSARKN